MNKQFLFKIGQGGVVNYLIYQCSDYLIFHMTFDILHQSYICQGYILNRFPLHHFFN